MRLLKLFVATLVFLAASQASCFAQLAHPQPEWYLTTPDGCQLFVQEFGNGPETFIVLHGGWGAEHSYLFDAFQGVAEKYHLVFYDQRGSLLSPCPLDKISVQKHVDDLDLLRKTLGLARINILAHSMGTFLAMTYLQQHPDNVRGLVLIGSFEPRTPQTDAEREMLADQQSGLQKILADTAALEPELHSLGIDPKNKSNWTAQQISLAWHLTFAQANIYHLDRWRQVKGGKAYYEAEAGSAAARTMPSEWDFTPAIAARTCPTWVLDGDHDYVTDPGGRMFKAATTQIPGVHVVALKDAGHLAWIDAPEQFAAALETALSSTTHCK